MTPFYTKDAHCVHGPIYGASKKNVIQSCATQKRDQYLDREIKTHKEKTVDTPHRHTKLGTFLISRPPQIKSDLVTRSQLDPNFAMIYGLLPDSFCGFSSLSVLPAYHFELVVGEKIELLGQHVD